MNKKKKPMQWFGMFLYMLIGALSGILLVRYLKQFKDISKSLYILLFFLSLISLYLAMLIQIIIHESGHLVFGLASGYQFNSFRIFNLMWLKKDGKIHLKHMSIAGTGGQCLMEPPDLHNGTMPVLLYNFGGAIFNLIASAIFFVLSFLFPASSFFTMFFRVLTLVGLGFAIMNGLPIHFGPIDNDGCNALSLIKDKDAIRAFWIQMKTNAELSKDIRLKDMPDEWFTVPDDEAMRNSLIATAGVLACNRLMDEHKFDEADALMEHLLSIESGIIDLYKAMMTCDRIFIELIHQNRQDKLDTLLTKEQKKLIKSLSNFPSVIRTEYAYALLSEQNNQKAQNAEKRFQKCESGYPYPAELAGEKELMQMALEKSKLGLLKYSHFYV